MTTEELLKPRYKVIADYPESPHKVGVVLSFITEREPVFPPIEELRSGNVTKTLFTDFINTPDGGMAMYDIKGVEPYPHLFRKLQWWEERNVAEIGYFKCASGEIVKLHEQSKSTPSDVYCRVHDSVHNQFYYGWLSLYSLLPATETEYLAYIEKNGKNQ